MPLIASEMSTYFDVTGSGDVTSANLAGGLNGVAPLTGSGDITNAALGLILSAVAALTGSGTVSGDIKGILNAVAALAGNGDLTGSITALAAVVAALTGTGAITATLNAPASMSADINVTGGTLTTANVAQAVLDGICNGAFTVQDVLNIIAAATAGKASGGPGSPVFRDLSDAQNVISGTADSSGNRTAATYTPP